MDVQAHDDPREFRTAVGSWYSVDPVRHTLAITVMARFLDDPLISPVMLTAHRDGVLHGIAFRTPPWPLIISGLPADAAAPVAAVLAEVDPELPGVNGPRELAEAFATAWAARTGACLHEAMAGRLYRLGELLPPTVPGRSRRATKADVPLLAQWRRAFQAEALGHDRQAERTEELLLTAIERGDGLALWETGGRVMSWANVGAPIDGMSRVGPVYTPPELRGHGYGSAVTAAASAWARDAGAEHVLLFTDLANPTSNSIYQKVGYRPVFDICEIEFTPAP
ncbi:MAG: GNAT family N-acetyltransferase [Actinophytocola sp.]|uniref:GNAT family N-acetyltransferase n=1 Tax=Actinophytocola sp. TaxID=1872138 RepID=UPI0013273DED|nr:GNAT family N-acetyltransferase [Actinophytocola sp.]MPZ81635.1 GNAT family N-acetyltransferase [Actinophytocola sp.]